MDSETQAQGIDLLQWFHAHALKDQGPPGFSGILAVGVVDEGAEAWWQVSFGARAEPVFLSQRPQHVDAAIELRADEANALLGGAATLASFDGNRFAGRRDLLHKFLSRYVLTHDLYSLRAAGARAQR